MLCPLQLRASAEDAALMTPAVMELQEHYRELKLPVVILTGDYFVIRLGEIGSLAGKVSSTASSTSFSWR
jgi:hypothetical protein